MAAYAKSKNKGPDDSLTRFRAALKEGRDKLGRCYVFYGPEDYLRGFYINEAINALVDEDKKDFNLNVFDGRSFSIEALGGAVESLPVFAERKAVLVKDVDIFKLDAIKTAGLEDILAGLEDYVCLIFNLSNSAEDLGKASKLTAALKKYAQLVFCDLADDALLQKWIIRRFSGLSKRCSAETAGRLIFMAGSAMNGLIPEIEKLAAYCGQEIKAADIDRIVVPRMEAVVYNMTDCIVEGRAGPALETLGSLYYQKHEPTVLLAAVNRVFRQLYFVKLAVREHKGQAYIKEALGIRYDFALRKLLGAAQRTGVELLRAAVIRGAELDAAMKSEYFDKSEALEIFVTELSSGVNP